jgi:hypothetical protein
MIRLLSRRSPCVPAVAGLLLGLAVESPVPARAQVDPIELEWRYVGGGSTVGADAALGDVDADGADEIVSLVRTPAGLYVRVLDRQGTDYSLRWASLVGSTSSIGEVVVAARTPLGVPDVIVSVAGTIAVYHGASGQLAIRLTPYGTGGMPKALHVTDIQGDGAVEYLYLLEHADGTTSLCIGDVNRASSASCQPGFDDNTAMAVGDVDGDGHQEIVVGDGRVLDGATLATEWSIPGLQATHLRLGDVDGDGALEIAAGHYVGYDSWLTIVDGTSHAVVWEYRPVMFVKALAVGNLDDGLEAEVIISDTPTTTRVLNGRTGAVEHVIPTQLGPYPSLALGDPDGDHARELVWGYAPIMAVYDVATLTEEWRGPGIQGPFAVLTPGDIDADGRPEILSRADGMAELSTTSAYLVFDAKSKTQEYASVPLGTRGAWSAITAANLDDDPQQEIVLGAQLDGQTLILCQDGLTHAEQWRTPLTGSLSPPDLLATADVDNDGELEVIALPVVDYQVQVIVLDGASGAEEWRAPITGHYAQRLVALRAADIGGDAAAEILVLYSGSPLDLIDATTHAITTLGTSAVSAFDLVDRDGDGLSEIVASLGSGDVVELSATDGSIVATLATGLGAMAALVVTDVGGDATLDYVMISGSSVRIVDGASLTLMWTSGSIADSVSSTRQLRAADVDEDGHLEALVGSDSGFLMYKLVPRVLLASASFPEGDDGEHAVVLPVALSYAPQDTVTVAYQTVAGSALPGEDYLSAQGVLTFTPGESVQDLPLTLIGDRLNEADVFFALTFSNPVNANLTSTRTTVTIQNDDPLPSLSVAGVQVKEGNFGFAAVSVPVSLSAPSGRDVTVEFSTADGTALAGSDYQSRRGLLTFPEGSTSLVIALLTVADRAPELNETFYLDLSAPTNAELGTTRALVTILDDDPAALAISNASVSEGGTAQFTVSLAPAQRVVVTVDWRTADGTATATSADYAASSGRLVFAPGVVRQTIGVPTWMDHRVEPAESFKVQLTRAAPGVTLVNGGIATGTIRDVGRRRTARLRQDDVAALGHGRPLLTDA